MPAARVDSLIYALTGHEPSRLSDLNISERRKLLETVQKQLSRERNKGCARHWSYDFNRHLALKATRDRVLDLLNTATPAFPSDGAPDQR